METKKCETCGADFGRPKDYSAPQWERRKFCSPKCVRGRLKRLGKKTRYRKLRLDDGRTVNEHRHIMEQSIGRPLLPSEHVHHRNGDKEDNRLENLEIINAKDHGRLHAIADAEYRRANGLPMGRAIAKAVKEATAL